MHLQVQEVWYFVLKFVDSELEALVVSIESAKYIVYIFGLYQHEGIIHISCIES